MLTCVYSVVIPKIRDMLIDLKITHTLIKKHSIPSWSETHKACQNDSLLTSFMRTITSLFYLGFAKEYFDLKIQK